MAGVIYLLCSLTALVCAWMLYRNYHRTRYRLLFWSTLCLAGLTVNDVLLLLDKLVFSDHNLLFLRDMTALISLSLLIYGLVWEAE